MRILLAEDDPPLGQAVQQALHDEALAVDWVTDGEAALLALCTESYDMLLLDLGLPKCSGLKVLEKLRRRKNSLPVIILTARDSIADRIQGLDHGADDYLVKPFSTAELMARIRAVIRRNHGAATPLLQNKDLTLDPTTHDVNCGESVVPLTAKEYALLHVLMLHPGRILSRESLEESIYGWNEEVASNAVEFIIHSLRKKLGKEVIQNVRGLGWRVRGTT